MKTVSLLTRGRGIGIVGVSLLVVALVAGMAGCTEEVADGPVAYRLTISSGTGGSVVSPGEGIFIYQEGTVVEIVARAEHDWEGGIPVRWSGDVETIDDINAQTTSIVMDGDKSITADFPRGRIEFVCVTPPPNTVLERGVVEFTVVVSYELEGVETGVVSADLGVPGGNRTVSIGWFVDVSAHEGVAIIKGTANVGHIHSVLQGHEDYEGILHLRIAVGYRLTPTSTFSWRTFVADCTYPVSEEEDEE